MGFIRRQEEKIAARLIQWHQQQQSDRPLSPEELTAKASLLVTEAHRVAKHRGSNLLTIMKEMVADVLKK